MRLAAPVDRSRGSTALTSVDLKPRLRRAPITGVSSTPAGVAAAGGTARLEAPAVSAAL